MKDLVRWCREATTLDTSALHKAGLEQRGPDLLALRLPHRLGYPISAPAIITAIYWTSRHSSTSTTNSVFLLRPQDDAPHTQASELFRLFSASDIHHTVLEPFVPFGRVLDIAVLQKHFTSEISNFKILL